MTATRVFFVGGLMSFRALFGWMRPVVFTTSLLVAPVFQILLFVYIGRAAELESDEFYVIGNALQYAAVPCIFAMTNTIAGERQQQTLGYILVTPASRVALFLGRSLPVLATGLFVSAFSLAVSTLLLGIEIQATAVAPLAVVIAATIFSCTGLGLVTAGIGLRVRETAVLGNIIFGLLLVFTGANAPLETMPGWTKAVSEALPFTHGIEAARRIVDGEGLGEVGGLVGLELLIGVAYGAIGFATLRAMEAMSRRQASLEVA